MKKDNSSIGIIAKFLMLQAAKMRKEAKWVFTRTTMVRINNGPSPMKMK